MNTEVIKRGSILWVDLNPTKGHEQKGSRPVIVISSTRINRLNSTIIVIPCTTKQTDWPVGIPIKSTERESWALIGQLRCLDPVQRECKVVGQVSRSELKQLEKGLRYLLELK